MNIAKKTFEKRYTSYTLQYKLDILNYMNEQVSGKQQRSLIFLHIPRFYNGKSQLEAEGIDALEPDALLVF